MAYSLTRKAKSLFPLCSSPSLSTLGSVALALLITRNEAILWEVVWLTRSVRESLFR